MLMHICESQRSWMACSGHKESMYKHSGQEAVMAQDMSSKTCCPRTTVDTDDMLGSVAALFVQREGSWCRSTLSSGAYQDLDTFSARRYAGLCGLPAAAKAQKEGMQQHIAANAARADIQVNKVSGRIDCSYCKCVQYTHRLC